ncbi:unnamed protein product [Chilo suppressalis]|uniref:Uncharacterized protein n=1 Tax=Chilo suppressalis TaxID=168631 RepID=A0ABN8BHE0_CHISP|nr:unnamed protein product [Chilo suppressalis]
MNAGVASRKTDPVSMPIDLPVRLYMRALRQYHKILDLKRLASKDKLKALSLAAPEYESFSGIMLSYATL